MNGKVLFPGNILINKTRPKFWGVTTLPPLRKISSSRFAKSCFEQKLFLSKENLFTAQKQSGYIERAVSGVKTTV